MSANRWDWEKDIFPVLTEIKAQITTPPTAGSTYPPYPDRAELEKQMPLPPELKDNLFRVNSFIKHTTGDGSLASILDEVQSVLNKCASDPRYPQQLMEKSKEVKLVFAKDLQQKAGIINSIFASCPTIVFIKSLQDYNTQITDVPNRAAEILGEKAISVLELLCLRVNWLLDRAAKSTASADSPAKNPLYVSLAIADFLTHDDDLIAQATALHVQMSATQLNLTNQLGRAWQEEYRKQTKSSGVSWMHSPGVQKEIKEAGSLEFRPTIIKRDRCVCTRCNEEIVGWQPWNDPSKHDHKGAKKT